MRTAFILLMIPLGWQASLAKAAAPVLTEIEWDSKQTGCDSPFVLSQELKSRNLIVQVEDLGVDKDSKRYLANCRLQGTITIPKGYALSPRTQAGAQFTVRELSRGERVEVQSRVSIANLNAVDSASIDMSEAGSRDEQKLQTLFKVPSVEACEATRTFKISFSNKILINARLDLASPLSADFDYLRISPLSLVPCDRVEANSDQ